MAKITIEQEGFECERCGHKWIPISEKIKTCPKCRSPYFDTPRKNKQKKRGEK